MMYMFSFDFWFVWMMSSNRGGMQSSECLSPLGNGVNDYVLLKVIVENSDTTEPDRHP